MPVPRGFRHPLWCDKARRAASAHGPRRDGRKALLAIRSACRLSTARRTPVWAVWTSDSVAAEATFEPGNRPHRDEADDPSADRRARTDGRWIHSLGTTPHDAAVEQLVGRVVVPPSSSRQEELSPSRKRSTTGPHLATLNVASSVDPLTRPVRSDVNSVTGEPSLTKTTAALDHRPDAVGWANIDGGSRCLSAELYAATAT